MLTAISFLLALQQPTLEQALAAARDVWGEASLREPDGPSFDFFARLLPPLRYVNTDFRHYPIVLGAPDRTVKARFVSDGSGVNLRAGTDTWHDAGLCPVAFSICNADAGRAFAKFGEDVSHLDGPRYVEGFLPIVEMSYRAGPIVVRQEAFAADDDALFLRFTLVEGAHAMIAAQVGPSSGMSARGRCVCDASGRTFVVSGGAWSWDERPQWLLADLKTGSSADLVVLTRGFVLAPTAGDGASAAAQPDPLRDGGYDAQRKRCADHWRSVIERSARIVTGEPRVDDAWRALVVGTLLLAQGDTLMYSAGNLYEQTFEAECGDAVRALMVLGVPDARRFVAPLLARPLQGGIELSDVSYKLQLFGWQHQLEPDATDRAARTRELLQLVQPEADRALGWIEPATGLVPAQAYCGDIATKVHNLYANAAFWRGVRDLAVVLRQLGAPAELAAAARYESAAAALQGHVLAAVAKSERNDVAPPFLPIALFGAEPPYELLTQTKEGAYWNLVAPFVYDSGIFGPGSPRTRAMVDWQLRRGGTCMGMVRFHQHSGLFANEDGLDDLYTFRLIEELLKRDDVDRALVAFYGKLAQGMTRDTFIGCEGSGLRPLDEHGRAMYLPPNCAANAFFLWTLRHLLVQDLDLDGDGRAETLRLLFATPRRWLADDAHLEVKRVPTKFGELSLDVRCDLAHRRVQVELELPPRPAERTLLRLRLPQEFAIERAVTSASAEGAELRVDPAGTIDLTGRRGRLVLDVSVIPAHDGR